MAGVIFQAVLSALAAIIAAYMQTKGIGTQDLVAAILALAGGNATATAQKAIQLKRASVAQSDAESKTPVKVTGVDDGRA